MGLIVVFNNTTAHRESYMRIIKQMLDYLLVHHAKQVNLNQVQHKDNKNVYK